MEIAWYYILSAVSRLKYPELRKLRVKGYPGSRSALENEQRSTRCMDRKTPAEQENASESYAESFKDTWDAGEDYLFQKELYFSTQIPFESTL